MFMANCIKQIHFLFHLLNLQFNKTFVFRRKPIRNLFNLLRDRFPKLSLDAKGAMFGQVFDSNYTKPLSN